MHQRSPVIAQLSAMPPAAATDSLRRQQHPMQELQLRWHIQALLPAPPLLSANSASQLIRRCQ